MQDQNEEELIATWTAARAEIAAHEIGTSEHERALQLAIACSEEYRRRLVDRRADEPAAADDRPGWTEARLALGPVAGSAEVA
jgi:hypothetical protein